MKYKANSSYSDTHTHIYIYDYICQQKFLSALNNKTLYIRYERRLAWNFRWHQAICLL